MRLNMTMTYAYNFFLHKTSVMIGHKYLRYMPMHQTVSTKNRSYLLLLARQVADLDQRYLNQYLQTQPEEATPETRLFQIGHC
jgi:hypothetical protein